MNKKLFVLLIAFFGLIKLSAQRNIEILEEIGFENLAEITEADHYYLCYENNRYRYEGDALIALLTVIELPEKINKVSLLIYNRGLGITMVAFSPNDLKALRKGNISSEIFTVSPIGIKNSLDFIIKEKEDAGFLEIVLISDRFPSFIIIESKLFS